MVTMLRARAERAECRPVVHIKKVENVQRKVWVYYLCVCKELAANVLEFTRPGKHTKSY